MQVCGNDSSDGAGGCYNDMVAMASSGNDANGGTWMMAAEWWLLVVLANDRW